MDSDIVDFTGCWDLAFVTNVQPSHLRVLFMCLGPCLWEERIELSCLQGPIHIYASCAKMNQEGLRKSNKQTNKNTEYMIVKYNICSKLLFFLL